MEGGAEGPWPPQSSSQTGTGNLSAGNTGTVNHSQLQLPEAPEILSVYTGRTKTSVPLIPLSRMSVEFRNHLETLKTDVHPGIFPQEDWNDVKRKEAPMVIAINKDDLSLIWKEVTEQAKKYKFNKFQDRMPIYYFLCSCVLKSKIIAMDNFAEGTTSLDKITGQGWTDARRTVVFHFFMMTEMAHRYCEFRLASRKRRRVN